MTERWEILTGDAAAIIPTLAPFDLVVTDPPYAASSQRPKRPEWGLTHSVVRAVALAVARAQEEGGHLLSRRDAAGNWQQDMIGAAP